MTVAFLCISGINPDHETWIWKTMLDDWGIRCPHEFQIRAIHRAAFHRDELVYIITKIFVTNSPNSNNRHNVVLNKIPEGD